MSAGLDRLTIALADRYRIERELGQGGMATVYLAEDLKHHRQVALKVLRPELAATMGPERFAREIEVAARLQHPHILPLHDSGEAGGFLYYVMPYVPGESLRHRLAHQGELPIHDAIKVLTEVVDALAHAHSHGVVHRDIKPDNVMLSGRHALVMDFGVAKAVSEATGRMQLTTAGVALGTPAYMAPEQAAAEPHLDHRVDIYAVGIMGYELLTGHPPFTGTSSQQVLAAHVMQAPEPITSRRPAVSPALGAVIMRCLAKRPADRWQTAEELLGQLEPLATPSGGVTPTQTQPVALSLPVRPGFSRTTLVAIAVVTLAVLGFLFARRGVSAAPVLGQRAAVTLDPGLELTPAISPDGKFIAYSRMSTTTSAVLVQQLAGGVPVTVADLPALTVAMPAWSPDGSRLLYLSPRGLEIVPALGGVSKVVVPRALSKLGLPDLVWGTWAPDGLRIVYGVGDTLFTRVLADSAPWVLVTGGQPNSPVWSPDGKWIAYVSGNNQYVPFANLAPSSIWVVAATGGPPVRITADQPLHASPVWQSDSRGLLYVSNQDGGRDVYRVELTGSGAPHGPPVRITTGLNPHTITLSSDGRRLAYSLHVETANVFAIALQPGRSVSLKEAKAITTGAQVIEGFAVSPDGKWLVFDSNRGGSQDIWRTPLDGSAPPEQLTSTPEDEFQPSYSVDGRFLAFHQTQSGSVRTLFIIPAAGGPPEKVSSTTTNNLAPRWAPNGQALSYLAADLGRICIVKRAPGAASWQQTTVSQLPPGTGSLEWSPDGKRVVYTVGADMVVALPDGGSPRVIAHVSSENALFWVRWGNDSRVIYAPAIMVDGRFFVFAVSPDGGPLREVAHSDGPTFQTFRMSMDIHGDTLYVGLTDRQSDIWMAEVGEKP